MSIETLTYVALADRLKISPAAARSLAKRRRFARCLSDSGLALVSVDLAEIRHTPRPRSNRPAGDVAMLAEKIAPAGRTITRAIGMALFVCGGVLIASGLIRGQIP